MLKFITYSPHLSAALAAISAALLPYYGGDRWFVAFPAVTAGLAALGIGPGSQASRSVPAVPPTPAGVQ